MELPRVNSSLVALFGQNLEANSSYKDENVTTEVLDELVLLNQQFKPVIDYLLVLILIIIMLSMGCEITWKQVNILALFFLNLFISCIFKENFFNNNMIYNSINFRWNCSVESAV